MKQSIFMFTSMPMSMATSMIDHVRVPVHGQGQVQGKEREQTVTWTGAQTGRGSQTRTRTWTRKGPKTVTRTRNGLRHRQGHSDKDRDTDRDTQWDHDCRKSDRSVVLQDIKLMKRLFSFIRVTNTWAFLVNAIYYIFSSSYQSCPYLYLPHVNVQMPHKTRCTNSFKNRAHA
jgi:hypothetical protein